LHVRGLKVTGVDSSPTMISLCRQRLPDQDWIVADMRNLSLDRRFDGVLAWDSFFHLDHESQRAMFAVFSAHASPGAMLMFNTGPQHGEGIGEYRGDPYHASLSSGEYQNLISQSGFKPSIMLSRTRGPADARYGFAGRGEVSAEQLSEEGRRASPSHNASSLTCP
jgi:cyclopropane fatty-acyl-phospholipid synthase-like methyltransferase